MQHNDTLYYSNSLQKAARKYLLKLPRGATMLVSAGASGCAIASAMLACTSKKNLIHYHIYPDSSLSLRDVSKFNSGIRPEQNESIVIVDDLIETGATIDGILNKLRFLCGDRNGVDNVKAILVATNDEAKIFRNDEDKIIPIRLIGTIE